MFFTPIVSGVVFMYYTYWEIIVDIIPKKSVVNDNIGRIQLRINKKWIIVAYFI